MSQKRKILQGSASNMGRVVLSMLVALVLPPLLVHRMMPAEYSAWVLILQISGYINLLDLGLQTAVGKFVAEYDAKGDRLAAAKTLSSSFAILCASASIGAIPIGVIAWQVPRVFHQMPGALVPDVRTGILSIGLSTVFALPFGTFLAVFTGLQRYGIPTLVAMASKGLSSAGLVVLLLMHGTLVQLAFLLAAFNIATAIAQFFAWERYAKNAVGFSLRLADRKSALRLMKYGMVLSIWSVAMLFISGLDLIIVGHYDFRNTGYYAIASSVTNFMVLVIGSVFSPLLPAISALQVARTSEQIGEMVVKTTRYCTLLVVLICVPLVLGASPLLQLWVGKDYALHSAVFLQILVLGNAVRQLGLPYSLAVVGTGRQHLATLAAVAEASVNVLLSLFLAKRIGAIGVAIGTLVGALVSIGMHLFVSMKLTASIISMPRRRFVSTGLFRPLLSLCPLLLLFWPKGFTFLPGQLPGIACVLAMLGIAWFYGLRNNERRDLTSAMRRLVR